MKMIWVVLFLLAPLMTTAGSSKDCKELKSEQLRLAFIASNLANVNTTRTPEGGPYKPYIIKSCSKGSCDVKRDDRGPLMKYLPDHPDANENGYVAYPNLDIKTDYVAFHLTAKKLKLLALTKTCGAKVVIDNGSSAFLVQYKASGTEVKEDLFNFDDQQRVISWMRQDQKGISTTQNFSANGEIISHY